MAARYWVGGTATWDATAATKWALTSGGAGGQAVPTSLDDVFFDAASGANTITLSASSVCNNLNCTNFVGTLSHPASTMLTVSGSLTFVSGMTYTKGHLTSSAILYNATSTGMIIATAEKLMGNATFDGLGGGWTFSGSYTSSNSTAALIAITNGALSTGNQAVTVGYLNITSGGTTRSLSLGSSTVTLKGDGIRVDSNTGYTFNAGTSTINFTADYVASVVYSTTFYNLNITSQGYFGYIYNYGQLTFNNLSIINSSTISTFNFSLSEDVVVNGTLTITGTNANVGRVSLSMYSTNVTPVQITAAAISLTHVNFHGVTASGAAAPWTSAYPIGDCGNNTNISTSTPTTRYWIGGTGGWINTSKWSTSSGGSGGASVPLPQDTAVFDANSFSGASQVVTMSAATSNCYDLVATNVSNSPTFSGSYINVYGDVVLGNVCTFAADCQLSLEGVHGTHTINQGNAIISSSVCPEAQSTTVNLASHAVYGSKLIIGNGVSGVIYNTNSYNVTAPSYSFLNTPTMNFGSSVITATGNETPAADLWDVSSVNMTASTATLVLQNPYSSTIVKKFIGGGGVYPTVIFSGDNISVSGNNQFDTLAVNNAGGANGIKFTASSTQTMRNFSNNGSSGSVNKMRSLTDGSQYSLALQGTVETVSYVDIKDSNVSSYWVKGTGFVDSGNNTGWLNEPPDLSGTGNMLIIFT